MGTEPRPLRADAERNRRRILDAAREVFAQRGLSVGVDVVAREAGVGVGTIYRRFPTKEQLLQAIVDDRLEELRDRLAGLESVEDPWEAFAAAAQVLAGAAARDRGFFESLQEATGVLAVPDCARQASLAAIAPFLTRAQAAGAARADAVPLDVLALCSNAARMPRWRAEAEPELWRRYVAIVLDGLRAEGAQALPHPPGSATGPRPTAGAAPDPVRTSA
jgi:AcrR family transcriptional regulator